MASTEEEHSPAYSLCVIDGCSAFSEDSDEVRPYRRQLLLLSERCIDSESDLANSAVAIQDGLKEKFVDVTLLEILRLVVVGTEGQDLQDCKLAFAFAGVALESSG